MITNFITEYLTTLLSDIPLDALNNASITISFVLAYIPIHILLRWLIGQKNATLALVAFLSTLVITLTSVFVGA